MTGNTRIRLVAIGLTTLLAAPLLAVAQESGAWGFDPGALVAGGDLLQRVPAREMDALFQAVHAAAQADDEAQAMCALFDPQGDRSLAGLNAAAWRLGPASRQRFSLAIADALAASLQSSPQRYDPAAAKQALKAAGVTAAIVHEGFVAGLNADGVDNDSRAQRCQSLRWLLDAMQSRPPQERAAMTRLLLDQGLARLSATQP